MVAIYVLRVKVAGNNSAGLLPLGGSQIVLAADKYSIICVERQKRQSAYTKTNLRPYDAGFRTRERDAAVI